MSQQFRMYVKLRKIKINLPVLIPAITYIIHSLNQVSPTFPLSENPIKGKPVFILYFDSIFVY